jgi:flagellar basal body-associated protein FliL
MSAAADPHAAAPAAAAAPPKGGVLSKLLPAVIVIAVVSGEGVAAYMLLPSAEANAKAAQDALAAEPPEHEDAHGHDKHAELTEVDLELYKITAYQPSSSITLRIEFRLYGMVPAEKAEDFKHSFEAKKNRVRDNVMGIIRSSDMNDLTDPELGLIKRKILETTNKAIGKPLLEGVAFSEFTFLEQ